MYEDEFSKLKDTIPEFNEKEDIRNNIIQKKFRNNDEKISYFPKKKLILRLCYVFILILTIFSIVSISINNINNTQEKKYLIEQERRKKLYLGENQNYFSQFVLNNESDDELSEYTIQMLEQNTQMEENKDIEDIYCEVTIDYKNGTTPQKIILKKGELIYPQVISNNGLYFLGWFINEQEMFIAHTITEDVYIYAKWADKKETTINNVYYEYYDDGNGIVILKALISKMETIYVIDEIDSKKVIGIDNNAYADNNINRYITKKVVFPDTIEFIKTNAFSGYENIEEINLPYNLNSMEYGVFIDNKNLEIINISELNNNYKCINNCLIDMRTKTLILGTKNSNIPNIVEVIEKYAFKDCKGLVNLIIPDSVKTIKSSAFLGCENLQTVKLSEELTNISDKLFYDCINLKEIYIGKNIDNISSYLVFANCSKLEKITISPDNPTYMSTDGCIIEKETKKLIYGVNISIIPEGVKIIGKSAFSGRDTLKSIIIRDEVEIIEASAFSNCINLQTVTISDSVIEIQDQAFYNCTKLKEIKMPNSLENFGSAVFYNCMSLEEITLPCGISSIPKYSFFGCKNLKNVNVNSVIEVVEEHSFSSCNLLEYFDLSKTKTIETSAFSHCTKLTNINLDNVISIGTLAFLACSQLGDVYIKETVMIIGSRAFHNCFNAVLYCEDKEQKDTWAEDFNDSVKCYFGMTKLIEYNNFSFRKIDDSLELVRYNGTDEYVAIPEKVENQVVVSIGTEAFMVNSNLKEVIFPNTIRVIKVNAFANCINLNNVVLPNSLVELEDNAFSGCTNLTNIKLNEGLEKIGECAFLMCDINSINLPSTLKSIGSGAFSQNYRLVEIYDLSTLDIRNRIPSEVGNVNQFVKGIVNSLNFPSGIFEIENGLRFYYNIQTDRVVLIDYNGKDCILNLPEYIDLPDHIIIPDDVEKTKLYKYNINHFAFYDNDIIVKVDIPNTVKGIGEKSFYSCQNLTSIVIPESIQTLGNSTFSNDNHLFEVYNLSSLELSIGSSTNGQVSLHAKYIYNSRDIVSKVIDGNDGFIYFIDGDQSYIVGYYGESKDVVLPETIKGYKYSIASSVFQNKDINSIILSNNILKIEERAFSHCLNLKEITIPSSVKFIGKYAFYNSGLEQAIFEDINNWYAYAPQSTYFAALDLTDIVYNASYLRNRTYYSYNWVKEENSYS